MAYYTGTANTLNDLMGFIKSALVDAGFSLTGTVYSKSGLHAELSVVGDGVSIGSVLNLTVGNTLTGSTLSDACSARIGPQQIAGLTGQTSWVWPCNYHIHVGTSPTEVYTMVNYGTFWQMIALGQSPASGNPGTGNWVHGTIGANATNVGESALALDMIDGVARNYYYGMNMGCCVPFFEGGVSGGTSLHSGSRVHGVYDNAGNIGWNPPLGSFKSTGTSGSTSSSTPSSPLVSILPNAWNLEAVLLPCQVFQMRVDSKVSLVIDLAHLRITRNDYLPDGEVVTLGPDRWKIYSAYRRDTANRNGPGSNRGGNHSGTLAIALRYDGA